MRVLISDWVEQEAGGPLSPSTPTVASLELAGVDDTWENSAQSLRLDFYWAPTVNETLLEVIHLFSYLSLISS